MSSASRLRRDGGGWKDIGVTQGVGSYTKHKQLHNMLSCHIYRDCFLSTSLSLKISTARKGGRFASLCTSAEPGQRFRARFLGKDLSARVLQLFSGSSSRSWSFTM